MFLDAAAYANQDKQKFEQAVTVANELIDFSYVKEKIDGLDVVFLGVYLFIIAMIDAKNHPRLKVVK